MTEGVLNLGDVEMTATADDPAMLVSVWEGGEFVGQQAVKVADATKADAPPQARSAKSRRRKRGG